MTAPVIGFTSTEVFDSTLGFGVFLRRFVPMLAGMYVLVSLMAALILKLVGLGVLALPLGLAVGALVAAGLVMSKKRQFDETWATTRLELSAAGAGMVNRYVRVQLPWEHIRKLGTANLVITRESTISGGGGPG